MKKTLIYCDLCGKEGAETCAFYVDRKMDPAGSMDDFYEYLDLCAVHQWMAYTIAEKKFGFTLGNEVYQELMRRRAVIKTQQKKKTA